jgi:hypothetical protein
MDIFGGLQDRVWTIYSLKKQNFIYRQEFEKDF